MTLKSLASWAAVPLLISAAAAAAAPATPDEAARLTELFQRYVGKPAAGQASAVTVTPQGDSYTAAFDISKMMAPLGSFGYSVMGTAPLTLTLTPQDDGLWHVVSGGLPSLAITGKNQTTTLTYNDYKYDGLFDPKLGFVKQASSQMSGMTADTVAPNGSSRTVYKGQFVSQQSGGAADGATVNIGATQNITGLNYILDLPAAAGDAGAGKVSITADAASAGGDSQLSHVSIASVLDLWQFLVAHASQDQLKAHADELKAKLQSALASNPTAAINAQVQKLKVGTPLGDFLLSQMDEHFTLAGEKDEQQVAFAIKGLGLAIPADKIPAWMEGLVPSAFDIGFKIGPLHVHDGLRKAVDNLDIAGATPWTDQQQQDVAKAFGDLDKLTLNLDPTTLTSSILVVKADGSASMPGGTPTGSFNVSATGLDKALEALQAKQEDNPDAKQAVAMLMIAKGVGKATGPDAYSWKIDLGAKGVMVNGQALSGAPPAKPDDGPGGNPDDDSGDDQQ